MSIIFSFFLMSFASANTRPKLERNHQAPEAGKYLKAKPYYVTAGKYDPSSEEIIYFLIKMGTEQPNVEDFLAFHRYYDKELDKIIERNTATPGAVVQSYEMMEVIQKYFDMSDEEFNKTLESHEQKIKHIKEIFAFKSNASYYKVVPEDSGVEIDNSGSLIKVLLSHENLRVQYVLSASAITLYESKEHELASQKELINRYLNELAYIRDSLPAKGAPIRASITNWLE